MPLGSLLGRLLPPWVLWAAVAVAIAGAYITGRIEQARADQAEAEHQLLEQARVDAKLTHQAIRRAQTLGQAHEDDKERTEVVFRTITKEVSRVVDRPIYRDCRLDPDGVRLLNAALAGVAPAEPAAQPPDPVPGPAPAR